MIHESNGTNGHTNGYTSYHGHNREEVTRILLQALSDLGYREAAEKLSQDSGYQLEIPSVASFRSAVLAGSWSEAEELLLDSELDGGVSLRTGLPLAEGADATDLRLAIRQQKYLELLEQRKLSDALHVLRTELAPLKRDTARLHNLSALIMCSSEDDLRTRANWDGAYGQSRQNLLSELSKSIAPSAMIPEHRLVTLLSNIQDQQMGHCLYHNTKEQPSLYTDHQCSPDDFPTETMLELEHHVDEVWHVTFSPQGKWLATSGRDGSVFVYRADTFDKYCEIKHPDRPDQRGICHISFSPDERYLLIASWSDMFTVTDLDHPQTPVAVFDHFDATVAASAWLPDCEHVIVGTQSAQKPLSMYNIHASHGDPKEVYSWRDSVASLIGSFRITNIAVNREGTRLAAATRKNPTILMFDLQTKARLAEFLMSNVVTSLEFALDGKSLLLSLHGSKVIVIDSATGEELETYTGVEIEQFQIRSCFGGATSNLVVSGSEDARIMIWQRQTAQEVANLPAHSNQAVNAVAWHPTNPAIFASAGDDHRVRIWTSPNALKRRKEDVFPLELIPSRLA